MPEIKIEETKWIIWSIEHGAWWAPDRRGYVKDKSRAGKYFYKDALEIVKGANINNLDVPNEAMIRVK